MYILFIKIFLVRLYVVIKDIGKYSVYFYWLYVRLKVRNFVLRGIKRMDIGI